MEDFPGVSSQKGRLPDITVKTTAVFRERCFQYFGIQPLVADSSGVNTCEIEAIEMRISEDQSLPHSQDDKNNENPDYWGWYDHKKQGIMLIYPKRFLLDMCFPHGIEREEKSETGKAYRLELITK